MRPEDNFEYSQNYGSRNPYTNKFLHPQLVKILAEIKTPSPWQVVSDEKQPISGQLQENRPRTSGIFQEGPKISFSKPKSEDKLVSLALETNPLLNRRRKK